MASGIVCPHCGHYNKPDWKMCDKCSRPLGAPLNNPPVADSQPPASTSPLLAILAPRAIVNDVRKTWWHGRAIPFLLLMLAVLFAVMLFCQTVRQNRALASDGLRLSAQGRELADDELQIDKIRNAMIMVSAAEDEEDKRVSDLADAVDDNSRAISANAETANETADVVNQNAETANENADIANENASVEDLGQ